MTQNASLTPLEKAIIAYREDPSDANKARLLAAQGQSVSSFYGKMSTSYIARTK